MIERVIYIPENFNEAKIEITSKLDTDSLYKATRYFDFANYTILSGCYIYNMFNIIKL